jgi:hypothetical protein
VAPMATDKATVPDGSVDAGLAPKSLRGGGTGSGRPCLCCASPEVRELDKLIVLGRQPKELASRFGVSRQSIAWHRAHHLPLATRDAGLQTVAAVEASHGASLVDDAHSLLERARTILGTAEGSGQLDTALRAIRESGRLLELIGKLRGEISNDTTINLVAAPIVLELQQAVMLGLASFPEAKASVLREIARLSGRDDRLTIEHQAT